MNYTMEYSEARGTWNIIDTEYNEWIYEGTYDQCCALMDAHFQCYCEEQDEMYNDYEPNDYYGD